MKGRSSVFRSAEAAQARCFHPRIEARDAQPLQARRGALRVAGLAAPAHQSEQGATLLDSVQPRRALGEGVAEARRHAAQLLDLLGRPAEARRALEDARVHHPESVERP